MRRPVLFIVGPQSPNRVKPIAMPSFFELIRRTSRVAAILLATAAVPRAAEPPPVPPAPQPTVRAYMKAMKAGDLDTAMKLTATVEGLPEARVRQGLETYSRTLKEQDVETVFHESRATQECALVIVEQRRPKMRAEPSLLPVMLVLRDGAWKVLPKLDKQLRETALSASQMDQIRVLGKWFVGMIDEVELRSREEYSRPLEATKATLAGAWRRSDDAILTLLKLDKDGTFTEARIKAGKLISRPRGRWSVADGRVRFNYDQATPTDSQTADQRVVAITRNLLGLEAAGKKRIWRRMPDSAHATLMKGLGDDLNSQ